MVVEVLGARVIGPFFGVSLFVWTALITVTLLSLSIGKFGVIFTRRQLMYSVIVLTAMLAIYVFILVEEGHNHEIGISFILA